MDIWRTLKALGSETARLQKVKIAYMRSSFISQSLPRFPAHVTQSPYACILRTVHQPQPCSPCADQPFPVYPNPTQQAQEFYTSVIDLLSMKEIQLLWKQGKFWVRISRHLETPVLADGFWDGTAPIHVAVRDLGTLQRKATVNKSGEDCKGKHPSETSSQL